MRSPPAMTRGGGGEGLRQHYLQNMHDRQLQVRQKYYSLNCPDAHCNDLNAKGSGVCMMSTAWKEEQHPSFIIFISSFLHTNSYRLNFLQIAPDFIFNNGGTSVAFLFITNWDCHDAPSVFSRVVTLKRQFRHLYVVVSAPTKEQNDSFNDSYFKHAMELGNPTFVPVCDPEMGFEKIVKIAHARGVCKQQDVISMMKLERMQSIEQMDCFLRVITTIPGIDNHDANALAGAVGSIEAISRASKEFILESTDLSVDKAERIFRFFRDPGYYLCPKIN
ncbi:protein PARTING DANCERS [Phalaenopsis equestris]|uniref:protein PARTING DANCERS n=1 Tax=Phalaenopsis equestris TaxID=78828 RepID=UPI0009E49B8E|nr:protein PARTING DANCERS [Phalaenopsis equestris]XP_020597151.1 protein PARTING DANCERS [Phalaenopsis equestris]